MALASSAPIARSGNTRASVVATLATRPAAACCFSRHRTVRSEQVPVAIRSYP